MVQEEFKFPDEEVVSEADETKQVEVTTDEDDVEIEVVDDTPEKDKGRKPLDREVTEPTDDELSAYSEGVKKRIKELTHARHDERRAKEALLREKQELERVARAMMDENKRLKGYVNSGQEAYAKVINSSAEMRLEAAQRMLKEAYDAGDSEAIVKAQSALTRATNDFDAARRFKPTPLQEESNEVQIPQSEPVRPQVDDKTLRWQAKNQWFGAEGHEEMTSFSLGLHQKLVNSGVDPRSDEYFERIDARMRKTFPEYFGTEETESPSTAPKKPATVVAPAARATGAKKIRLTNTQVALAKKFGLTPQQYAMELAKLEK